MMDSINPLRIGVFPESYYDSNTFCDIMNIARDRRRQLQREVLQRNCGIKNGDSVIATGEVFLDVLQNISNS
jgi:hypothetical protein